jgi:hypothetical protein
MDPRLPEDRAAPAGTPDATSFFDMESRDQGHPPRHLQHAATHGKQAVAARSPTRVNPGEPKPQDDQIDAKARTAHVDQP